MVLSAVWAAILATELFTWLVSGWAALMAIGLFIAAIVSMARGFMGRAAVFALLGLLLAGAAGTLAAVS